jgi:hypothetical protein
MLHTLAIQQVRIAPDSTPSLAASDERDLEAVERVEFLHTICSVTFVVDEITE